MGASWHSSSACRAKPSSPVLEYTCTAWSGVATATQSVWPCLAAAAAKQTCPRLCENDAIVPESWGRRSGIGFAATLQQKNKLSCPAQHIGNWQLWICCRVLAICEGNVGLGGHHAHGPGGHARQPKGACFEAVPGGGGLHRCPQVRGGRCYCPKPLPELRFSLALLHGLPALIAGLRWWGPVSSLPPISHCARRARRHHPCTPAAACSQRQPPRVLRAMLPHPAQAPVWL